MKNTAINQVARNAAKNTHAPVVGVKPPQAPQGAKVSVPEVAPPAPPPAAVAVPQVAPPTSGNAADTPRSPGRPAKARGADTDTVILPATSLVEMLDGIPGLSELTLDAAPIYIPEAARETLKQAAAAPLRAMGMPDEQIKVITDAYDAPIGKEKKTLAQLKEGNQSAEFTRTEVRQFFRLMADASFEAAKEFDPELKPLLEERRKEMAEADAASGLQ